MKDPKRPSNTTTTTTSFFFKGRPKQVLSEVKKVLEISDDDGEEEGEGEGDSQEEVATPVQIPASKQPKVTVEVIDLCEEEKVTPEKRKILPEVMKKYKLRVETPKESFPKQPQTINSSPMMDSCPPVRVTIHDERSSKEGEYLVPSVLSPLS